VITKLISQLHRGSGEVVKRHPRCLPKNTSAVVEITLNRPVSLELYRDVKELGRFMLRCSGVTIAAGLVTKVTVSMYHLNGKLIFFVCRFSETKPCHYVVEQLFGKNERAVIFSTKGLKKSVQK